MAGPFMKAKIDFEVIYGGPRNQVADFIESLMKWQIDMILEIKMSPLYNADFN